MSDSNVDCRRRGAVSAGALLLILLVLIVLGGGACGVGKYNGMVKDKETVSSRWSDVDNTYQRRNELIPQLLETVKGAADFEKSVLTEVTEARASVGQIKIDSVPTDAKQLEAYMKAQEGLGGALGRLLAVAENYPQLKATESFLSFQDQIEGTENRIATARTDYIEAVRQYNTSIKTFPGNLVAGFTGFEEVPQLTVDAEQRKVPKIDFGSGE